MTEHPSLPESLPSSRFTAANNLRLLYSGSHTIPEGRTFHMPLHHHPGVNELLLILDGSATFLFDGRRYEAGPRSIVFHNEGLWHEERSHAGRTPYSTMWIGFSGLQLDGLPPGFFVAPDASPVVQLQERFFATEQRLRELHRIDMERSPESGFIANHLLAVFLGELAAWIHYPGQQGRKGFAAERCVAEVKRYIQEHYAEQVTLQSLSNATHVSPFHLSRLFKKTTGMSPIHYLIRYRLEVAKQYLRTTDATIDKIAQWIGYRSEAHFYHAFKKWEGMSPSGYRAGE